MPGGARTESRVIEAPTGVPHGEPGALRVCLNCGEPVVNRFCSACGQALIDPDPTLGEFLHEAAEEFLHWDGKLFTTFRLLLTKPGVLTREYLAGRRVRHLSPLRLYLTCSVLFFALKALTPEPPVVIVAASRTRAPSGMVTIQEDSEGESLAELDRLARSPKTSERLFGRHMGNALRHRQEVSAALRENVPNAMFVLVPIFAALAALVFRDRRMRYPQHLAFALHTHAFLFLALLLTLIPRVTSHGVVGALAVLVSYLGIAVYSVLAVRCVYGGSIGGAIVRSGALAAIYFVCFTAAMLVTFAAVVALRF